MGKTRKLSVGELIAARLDELGLSQSDLAKQIGVYTSTVSRWISNKRSVSFEKALPLANALGVPVESLAPARS